MIRRATSKSRASITFAVVLAFLLSLVAGAVHAAGHCDHSHGSLTAANVTHAHSGDHGGSVDPVKSDTSSKQTAAHDCCGFACHGVLGLPALFGISIRTAAPVAAQSTTTAFMPISPPEVERPPMAYSRA